MIQRSTHDAIAEIKSPVAEGCEEALLAGLLKDPSKMDLVAAQLGGGDFADKDLAALYEALVSLHEAGRCIGDAHVLMRDLRGLGVPDSVGSVAAIAKLLSRGVSGHESYYVQQIREAATLTRYQRVGLELIERTQSDAADAEEIRKWLDAQLQSADARQQASVRCIGDIAGDVLGDIDSAQANPRGVFTGIYTYDFGCGPLMPGEQNILAARPGEGKTAFACQIAHHTAQKGRPVLFVTIEMKQRQLVNRMMCGLAGVDSRDVRAGNISGDDRQRLIVAQQSLREMPLHIWDPPQPTVAEIRGVAKLQQARGGLDLIIVDYIGLVRPLNAKEPRHEQVRVISAALKAMAKELDVALLTLCQLNREADGVRPTLGMLRDSGAIEQDADAVHFLNPSDGDGIELLIPKHRYGPRGEMGLTFDRKRGKFSDPAVPCYGSYQDGKSAAGGDF